MRNRTEMKILMHFLIIIGCLIFISPGISIGLDQPHDKTSGENIDCSNCHLVTGMSTPPWVNPQGGGPDDTMANRKCTQCHDGTHPGIPAAKTHSSTTTGSTRWAPNGWTTQCVDCHNPHYQRQTRMWNTATYLTTGTVAGIGAYNAGTNQTPITLTAPLGAEYNGYYFIPNIAYRMYMYKIKANTNGQSTIYVKGQVNTTYATAGKTYAIVYAKNVNDYITYIKPDATVKQGNIKLFRPSGSFGPTDPANKATSVCYFCHDLTNYWSPSGSDTHNAGTACTSCHAHSEGFKGSCESCHGYPPNSTATLVFKDRNGVNVTSDSTGPGAHVKHRTVGFTCENCHTGGMLGGVAQGDDLINIGFNLGGTNLSASYDGISERTVFPYSAGGSTTITTSGTQICSNLYCHGSTMDVAGDKNGGTNITPKWTDSSTGQCGTCHGATAAAPPKRGSHAKHTGNSATGGGAGGMQYACTVCHSDYSTKHVNGSANWSFDTTTYSKLSGAQYKGSTSGSASPVPSASYGQCSNLYCHSNVQPEGGVGAPSTYSTPTWGGTIPVCGSCHKADNVHAFSSVMDSGSHTKHLLYKFSTGSSALRCVVCHKWNATAALTDCGQCHTSFASKHANFEVDVIFDSTFGGNYSGTPAPGDGYGSCSNVYCHSDGTATPTYTNPTWANAASGACGTCHGATKASPPATGNHAKHAGSGDVYQFNCFKCHTLTVNDNAPATISSSGYDTYHVNKQRNVSIQPYTAGSVPGGGTYSSGLCTNVYCHSNAKVGTAVVQYADPTWGGGSLSCNGCHGTGNSQGYPDYVSGGAGSATANSHFKHAASTQSNINCSVCHNQTTATGNSIRADVSPTKHVNANIQDVYFDGTTSGGTYTTGTKTCSSTYCHGTGTPVWGGASMACSSCHSASNALLGKHSTHYASATDATDRTAANNSTNGAYIFNCGVCHDPSATTHAGGAVSANQAAQVSFDATIAGGGTYTAGSSVEGTDRGFNWTAGAVSNACANIYCHSDGNGGAPNNTTFQWTATSTLDCKGCHGYTVASGTAITSGKHTKHLTDYALSCSKCHNATTTDGTSITDKTKHVNKTKDVAWDATNSDGSVYSSPNCSNIYCHSQGTSNTSPYPAPNIAAAWNGTLDATCTGCHNGDNNATNKMSTGSHTKHVVESGIDCTNCHNATASDSRTIGTPSNHANKLVNIAFSSSAAVGGQYKGIASPMTVTPGTLPYGSCSNITCHSNGTWIYTGGTGTGSTQQWGTAGGCNNCHGNATYTDYRKGAPLYASGTPKPNAHIYHTYRGTTPSGETQCLHCHNTTTSNNTTVATPPHKNDSYTIAAGSTFKDGDNSGGAAVAVTANYTFKGAADGSTCSNVSCHPTGLAGTKAASTTKWSNTYSCTDCHNIDLDNNTSYHHVMDVTAMANRNYPTSAPSSSATDANRKCTMCHVDHDVFSPMLNADAALTSPRAMNLRTIISTAPTASANGYSAGFANSDYAAGGGICISCHNTELSKNTTLRKDDGTTKTMAITDAGYSGSAHQYNITSTMANGGANFNANCSKCHNSKNNETTTFQSSTNKFGAHDNPLRRLLASLGMTAAADPEEEDFCYRCHSRTADTNPGGGPAKAVANKDYYNAAAMTANSEKIFSVMQGQGYGTTTSSTLYLRNTNAINTVPPTKPSAYQYSSGTYTTNTFNQRDMAPTSGTTGTTTSIATGTTAPRYDRGIQFVSPQINNTITIPSGSNFSLTITEQRAAGTSTDYTRFTVYKWDGSVATPFNTSAAPNNFAQSGTAIPTTATIRTITFTSNQNVTLNPGDCIVVDIEYLHQSGTTNLNVTYSYGNYGTDQAALALPAGTYEWRTSLPTKYGHNVAGYSGKHKPSSTDETRAYLSANKHIECNDCHNPHEAKAGTNTGTQTNWASNALMGAPSVNPTMGSGMFSTATSWTEGKTASTGTYIYEYQICYRCHSSYNQNLTTWNSNWTPVDREFNPANEGNYAGSWASGETAGSFHPVMAAATNNLGRTPNIISPWTTSSVMMCSDCHASNTTTDPNGPHGSAAKYILKGPNTTWNESVTSIANNAWMPAGTFCLNCHSNSASSGRFSGHSRGNHSVNCSKCHVMIPHGSEHPGLLHSAAGRDAGVPTPTYVNSAPYMRATTGNRLYIKSYPTNQTAGWAQSNCGCNGTGH